MDDQIERPGLFDLWPSVTYINCPHCDAHWFELRFYAKGARFPHLVSSVDAPDSQDHAYCPRCSTLLPSIDELAALDHAIGRSPTFGKPFVGTTSGIRSFLGKSQGAPTKLWNYVVSHSQLVLKLNSTTDKTHAFVVCLMTQTVVLPSVSFKSSLVLESVDTDTWALRDKTAGVEVVCCGIGIFYSLDILW